jgi:hypothetical protein
MAQGLWRGTATRDAHGAAGPRPWRAWVRPAGARAHHHLQQPTHGTKAGFTAARDTAQNACWRCPTGDEATATARMGAAGRRPRHQILRKSPRLRGRVHITRHASTCGGSPRGALRRKGQARSPGWRRVARSARRTTARHPTARHGVFPQPHLQKLQEPHRNGDSTGGVTAWGSHDPRLPLTRRDTASPLGRRRRARSDRGGSMARAQAGHLRRPAQGEARAHRGSSV